jgi:hypothetical protein
MNMERLIQGVYGNLYVRIGLHLSFWILLVAVHYYLNGISFHPYKNFPFITDLLLVIAGVLSIILFYYPFVYFVLPRLFYKKRFITGTFCTLALIILYALYDTTRENLLLKDCASCMETLKTSNSGYYHFLQAPLPNRLSAKLASMGTAIGLLFSLALPLSIKFGMQALRQQFRSMQLTKDNLKLEFNFLRSQVNPHFLFNTLNNVYGLILNDDKAKSAAVVAKLSQFLRYSLYESNGDEVPADKELQLLKDYIDLESIRLNHTRVKFNCTTDGSVSTMPPVLLIPVVENAFKYCSDSINGYIDISIQVKDGNIFFYSKNSIDTDRQSAAVGGIGLSNLDKRLRLYYPGKHQCKMLSTDKEYSVSINIDCHE